MHGNCGVSLDPATGPFPAVESNFGSSYDFAVGALAGLVSEVVSNYNLTKTLSVLPEGTHVPRHFRTHEVEWYGQDQWRLKPNFTLTSDILTSEEINKNRLCKSGVGLCLGKWSRSR